MVGNGRHVCLFFVCTGSVEFVESGLRLLRGESSIEVCIRVEGYGFTVNLLTGERS